MMRRAFLIFLMAVMAVGLQSNEIGVTTLRSKAMKGLNVESGYEQEMAAWAYYCINGADGVSKDYYEAVKILKKLVARNKNKVDSDKLTYVVEGYNMLGICYEKGYGVQKDIDKARGYWQQAAKYNHAEAQEKLEKYPTSPYVTFVQTVPGTNVSFKMVAVKGGTFQMGPYDSEADSEEKPIHNVTLSDFYIGETEVTQELWKAVMGSKPSYFRDPKNPVEYVSWNDCQEFIKKLNQLTGKNFRLPTEAEWEYAARGGKKSKSHKYSGSNTIGDVAWYWDNASLRTHRVGTKSPNELGIYDMSGNVWEWCSDWYDSRYYSSSSSTNPTGPSSGSYRVLRGGSWHYDARYCRVAIRGGTSPSGRDYSIGFRLALRP